jgi:hypothetical protein
MNIWQNVRNWEKTVQIADLYMCEAIVFDEK